jgi:hypothetical protein
MLLSCFANRFAFLPALLLAASACASSTDTSGSGSGATVGDQCSAIGNAYCTHVVNDCLVQAPDGGPVTAGDQCTEVAQALCSAQASCGTGTVQSDCVQQAVQACCGANNLCGDSVDSPESAIHTCTSAIAQNACLYSASYLPPQCTQVVQATGGLSNCESQALQACCGQNGRCGEAARSSQSAIDGCSSAVQTLACGATSLPLECSGVVLESVAPRLRAEAIRGLHVGMAGVVNVGNR